MAEEATSSSVADTTEQQSEKADEKLTSVGEAGTGVHPTPATEMSPSTSTQPPLPHTQVPNCTFCRIINKQLRSEIIYEDEEFVGFIDRSPASTHHYLVVPRQHIRDARSLSEDQLSIIDRMADVGKRVLSERGGSVDDVRMGFHWPPFLMVRHIHLHVISPASRMGWLHRNVVFRQDSFAFTSPTATIDYLRKSLNK